MQNRRILAAVLLAVCIGSPAWASGFALYSPDITNGGAVPVQQVFDEGGCPGQNISPALAWRQAPQAAKSYAITLFDPDADAGKGFWHWAVFDIPASLTSLPRNAGNIAEKVMPANAVQIRNDFGVYGYGGPCPPAGQIHHYVFSVYALDVVELSGLSTDASPAAFAVALRAHVLAQARIVAIYP